jgi:hypothetical protein
VSIDSEDEDDDKIDVDVEGDRLSIRYRDVDLDETFRNRNRVRVSVTMPTMRSLNLTGATQATVRGFNDLNELDVNLVGAVEADLELEADHLDIDLTGASVLTLRGQANRLEADVNSASRLDAFGLRTEEAIVSASSAGEANVNVSNRLEADASMGSNIRFQGNPNLQSNESSGGSISREE